MKQVDFISITLQYSNKQLDLRIPTRVSIVRLKELLKEALLSIQIQLPPSFDLVVINKAIRLRAEDMLADYPLGNGDSFEIKES